MFLLLGLVANPVPFQPPVIEIAPFPRVHYPPVQIEAVKGGYRVYLNRSTAERLADALEGVDPKDVAARLKKRAKDEGSRSAGRGGRQDA